MMISFLIPNWYCISEISSSRNNVKFDFTQINGILRKLSLHKMKVWIFFSRVITPRVNTNCERADIFHGYFRWKMVDKTLKTNRNGKVQNMRFVRKTMMLAKKLFVKVYLIRRYGVRYYERHKTHLASHF